MRPYLLYLAVITTSLVPACTDSRDRSAAEQVHGALQPGMTLKDVIEIVNAAPRPHSTVVLGKCRDARSYAAHLPTHERGYKVGVWHERDIDGLEHIGNVEYESLDGLVAQMESHQPCGEIYAGFSRWGVTMELDRKGAIRSIARPAFTE